MRTYLLAAALTLPAAVHAQQARVPARTVPAAMSAITEADLKRDLYFLGGDGMRGREAGTLDEMRASVWLAAELQKIGVAPMGEDGTYFQWWHMRRTRLGASSVIKLGDRSFALWSDIAVSSNNEADVSGTIVWAGNGTDTTIDVRGKIAVAQLVAPAPGGRETSVNSPEYRYTNRAVPAAGNALVQRGAIAVVLIADSVAEKAFDGYKNIRARGTYAVDGLAGGRGGGRGAAAPDRPNGTGAACGGPSIAVDTTAGRGGGGRAGAGGGGRGGAGGGRGGGLGGAAAPIFLVRQQAYNDARGAAGKEATIRLFRESFTYPSVNIVGVVRGTDPALRNEYVLFSSHQDHDGVRYEINGDSIWNGADDNGTVSVALLAAARAFVKQPGRRSALFVYHGAEERGLLGSRYYVQHPIVPLAQTVAVLNGDMLGRNSPDSASIMGVQPPHMNSRELVAMALQANDLTGKFKLDSIWDRPTHVEGWYRRSDHLPYAESCVPALMYSANLHPDYHTPRDGPETINYPKLYRMTQWMYLTGWFVANTDKRPALEPVFDVRR
ncbi:MAG TPA: M28 family peptidase [Gemmatimonadaceae bacterium]|nr:M28 family peptidase [Gemmatimonadaceae bacterium]